MPSFRDEQRLIHVAESDVYSTAASKPTAFHKASPIGRSVSYSSAVRGFGSVLAEDNVDGAISWTRARRKNWIRGPRVRTPDAWKPVSSLIADIGNRIDSLPARNDTLDRAGSFDFPPPPSISLTRPFVRRSSMRRTVWIGDRDREKDRFLRYDSSTISARQELFNDRYFLSYGGEIVLAAGQRDIRIEF